MLLKSWATPPASLPTDFHLLGLEQLSLQFLEGGDVHKISQDCPFASILGAGDRFHHPAGRAILGDESIFIRGQTFPLQPLDGLLPHKYPVFRVHVIETALADQFLGAVAGDGFKPGVNHDKLAILNDIDAHGGRAYQGLERLLRPLALGDVPQESN